MKGSPTAPTKSLGRSGPSLSIFRPHCVSALAYTSVLALAFGLFSSLAKDRNRPSIETKTDGLPSLARLSESVSVHASGRDTPAMRLSDGHDLITSYTGNALLADVLTRNAAQPRTLASADFDEDGTPDLISGYAHEQRGIATLLRGNVDSVYPNAPEAQERRALGNFTDAPFLSQGRVFELKDNPDFLGAGDFDADGHWDIVFARRAGDQLNFMLGDGKGNFHQSQSVAVAGNVTALNVGEINRRDGLSDVIVALDGTEGPRLFVFEGPLGAMRSTPEVIELPGSVTSLALGEIDGDYPMDLVAAVGNRLLIVHGRDRKLSLGKAEKASVPPPRFTERAFDFGLRSVAIGDFSGDGFKDLAVLSTHGSIGVLIQPAVSQEAWAKIKKQVENYSDGRVSSFDRQGASKDTPLRILPPFRLNQWALKMMSDEDWPGAESLITTRVSSVSADTLVLMDKQAAQIHVVSKTRRAKRKIPEKQETTHSSGVSDWQSVSLDVSTAPTAVIPMRLDEDALSDLVILREHTTQPNILLASPGVKSPLPTAPYFSFTKDEFISVNSFFELPGRATRYPSTISVSGVADSNSKIRVRLNDMYSNNPNHVDALLVSPAGQKVILMSDACGSTISGGNFVTFDDTAPTSLPSVLASGSFKPTNIDSGSPDVFPSPAPGPPYAATLSAFNGSNLNGVWNLFLVDDSPGPSQSQLEHGWTLIFGDDPPPQDFIVTNTNNSGLGSLRQAIINSNEKPGADRITFSIGSGPQTITLQSFLPDLEEAVTIDGTTQPGFAGVPIIEINGANTSQFTDGLVFTGGNSVVRGLVINRFPDDGIGLLQGSNNFIEGCYVGTDLAGNLDRGNLQNGISVDTANNTIGGTVAAARNVVSGNDLEGILLATFYSDLAENNVVRGNFIGTNAAGNALIQNEFDGVSFSSAPGSPNNLIGGTIAGARNVIAGSTFARVDITYAGSSGTMVQGNYIGTDVTGTVDLDGQFGSGSGEGVGLSNGAGDCLIGGTTPAARNILSGNWWGVRLNTNNTGGAPPIRNLIQGNFIGTNVNGNVALRNIFSGVDLIFGATQNTIGGDVVEARNIISGNQKAGVQVGIINQVATFTNVIKNNYIGTDLTGNNPLPNGNGFDPSGGIIIPANADGDRIEKNRIAYNLGSGIRITNVSGSDQPGIRILIIDNEIYSNTGLGIDLGGTGITPNDQLDADSGPNLLQNFPVLTGFTNAPVRNGLSDADSAGGPPPEELTVAVSGTLNSTANTTFTVHWYFSADSQCVTNQAGTQPLVTGRIPNLTTDINGNAPFSFPFDFPIGFTNGIINCTATDAQGNTSEFSACLVVNAGGTAPPANNNFASAQVITGNSGSVSGSNVNATKETGEPNHAGNAGGKSVWYRWQAPASVGMLMTTQGSNFDTLLGVYTGTSVNALTTIASNDDASPPSVLTSRVTFNATAGTTYRIAVDGLNGASGNVTLNWSPAPVTIQFTTTSYSVAENGGTASVNVSRSGDSSSTATVNYTTSDTAGLNNCNVVNGIASSRCDYATSVGTLRFIAGETARTIPIPIVDDSYAEGNDRFNIMLSNATGGSLGAPASATVTINDNETTNGPNPIVQTTFFVRQHYIDFLNREPDSAGAAAWEAVINNCPPGDTTCDRIHVSSAFFRSPEFQGRGYFIYRFYPTSFGRKPEYVEFIPDLAKVSGFLSDAELEAAKVAFITEFMNRPAFVTKFNSLNNTQYVDTLLSTAGVAPHQFRDFWIAALGNGTRTRATVLRDIAESIEVYNKYYNQAFVVMQYFGYLRRDPDALYLDWIAVLDSSGDYRGMVNGFSNSLEYRFRFGP